MKAIAALAMIPCLAMADVTITDGVTSKQCASVTVTMTGCVPVNVTPSVPLQNVSLRGYVGTGDQVLIMGFILPSPQTVYLRARGPSLAGAVAGPLADPRLTVVDQAAQKIVGTNDDSDGKESALTMTLKAGAYTVIVDSKSGTGVGIVELFPR